MVDDMESGSVREVQQRLVATETKSQTGSQGIPTLGHEELQTLTDC